MDCENVLKKVKISEERRRRKRQNLVHKKKTNKRTIFLDKDFFVKMFL